MMLDSRPEKKLWNEFVEQRSSPASFLQTHDWGEFQAALGQQVYRLRIPANSAGRQDLIQAQVIVKQLPLGKTYLEIPKGPIVSQVDSNQYSVVSELVEKLKEIGRSEKAVLVRINPPYKKMVADFGKLGFGKPQLLLHQREPEHTILVDLSKSEEELLANMHEKARYNIRLAQRKGVQVRLATTEEGAFERFLFLLEETTKRDKIITWPKDRFVKFRELFMTRTVAGESQAELLVGELNGQILATAIVMFFGDSGTYLYAASSGEERSANVPSLVLWEAIRLAKARSKKWYDMWGIAPAGEPAHPWAGITRFKSRYVKVGVTGREVHYPGAQDLIINKFFYRLFLLAKKFQP